jgi:predicted GTPase
MIQTSTNKWVNKLAVLYQTIPLNSEQNIKNKCIDFMQKIDDQELAIAFTGHFSAGKSSLMNNLFNISLLPTSPIPTSANVVKVKHGADKIQFRYFDGSIQEVVGSYNEEAFQALCQDGDRATEILIERMDIPLPSGVAVVDTPGVDSTDEAHRIATEASLHISDVIFYMMDYNHVQAEGNLKFVKELTDRGKQVYLIINQIDKHRDTELSFADFQQGVGTSFAAWDIRVAGIYFTSLKQPKHPHNQLTQLKELLHHLYRNKDPLIEQNVEREMNYLIQQYIDKKISALPSLETLQSELQTDQDKKSNYQRQQEQWKIEKQQIADQLMKDLDHILQNAYLMPANLREQAKTYLEAMQPDFKMGLWFAKKKTEQERSHREKQFFRSLVDTISTQLTGHIEDLVIQHAKKHHIFQASLADDIHESIPEITCELLRKTIKKGAGISGNYVLTYTNDLVEEIKTLYRIFVRQYLSDHLPQLEAEVECNIQKVEMECKKLETRLQHVEQNLQMHADITVKQKELQMLLEKDTVHVPDHVVKELLQARKTRGETTSLLTESFVTNQEKTTPQIEDLPISSSSMKHKEQLLLQAEETLAPVSELQIFFEQLKSKRLQLKQQQFTVALFGAFSAGKSSFANALLGASVLPVSPNPTTATVCRICPPSTEHLHGMATVAFKSQKTLYQELQHLFQLFRKETLPADIEEVINKIPSLLDSPLETTRQKLAIPFLRAIQDGYTELEHQLGRTVSMKQADAALYMADERKSAFVEEVSLYYDSILSKLGITLVDTPGADSLHARHTDVAFRYMKQADALLFVTYYNHAFSKADRELLIQLGRVQDSFALDKMYFIVNAADLASSMDELNKVVAYVESQLNQYGIRHPRMYPVSSLESLEDKMQNRDLNRAFSHFEQSFFRFIQEDSRAATTGRMITDVQQAVNWIEEMLTALRTSESEKEDQQQRWKQAEDRLVQSFSSLSSTMEERNLVQEIKTLLYYVGERLRLRYYDEFAFYINPSTIRQSGRAGRTQLATAAKELLSFIGNDLIQEFRATSLRLEKWVQTALSTFTDQQSTHYKTQLSGLSLGMPNEFVLPEIDWTQPNWEENHPIFQKAISLYKNNQSFFEQNGRDRMKEQLKLQVDEVITSHITQITEKLITSYTTAWKQNIDNLSSVWTKQVIDHFARLHTSLQGNIDEQPLIESKKKLEQLLAKLS